MSFSQNVLKQQRLDELIKQRIGTDLSYNFEHS